MREGRDLRKMLLLFRAAKNMKFSVTYSLLCQKNHNEHVQDIAQRLREDFENWQGIEPRRDDVTVVIFKL